MQFLSLEALASACLHSAADAIIFCDKVRGTRGCGYVGGCRVCPSFVWRLRQIPRLEGCQYKSIMHTGDIVAIKFTTGSRAGEEI